MNTIIRSIALVGVTLSMGACTGGYIDINSHPYEPGDLRADDYLMGSAFAKLSGTVMSSDVNTLQFTDLLLGGTMGGYFADAQDGWGSTISNFNPTNDWTRVFMNSDQVMPVLFTNYSIICAESERLGDPVPAAIARIIKVAAMHRVSDTYGPIPYSKIVGGTKDVSVPYDSEPDLFKTYFEELDQSIKELSGKSYTLNADKVYGGNPAKWARFANSLKLRLAMRIVYADRTLAKKMAEEAVHAPAGLITDNADNAVWNYFGSVKNPFYVASRYNSPAGTMTGGDSHASADIIAYMNGYNDPRRAKYFVPSEWSGIQYVGLRRGIDIPSLDEYGRKYSGIQVTESDPITWMNASEVAFLKAEAVAVFGFDMGDTAENLYNTGIKLSFDQYGVPGAEDYLNNTDNIPETYSDPAGMNSYSEPLSDVTIKWDERATPEKKQERIIIQKWIANWMIGNEAWADFRRTGYPTRIPATEAGNKSNGRIDSTTGPRRMPYPQEEYGKESGKYVKDAVAQYLKGADDMNTKLWWDAKPMN